MKKKAKEMVKKNNLFNFILTNLIIDKLNFILRCEILLSAFGYISRNKRNKKKNRS